MVCKITKGVRMKFLVVILMMTFAVQAMACDSGSKKGKGCEKRIETPAM